MGNVAKADQLEILWPSGVVEVLRDIAANQVVTVKEGQGIVTQHEFEASRASR
jgi:hypothetical protein